MTSPMGPPRNCPFENKEGGVGWRDTDTQESEGESRIFLR
jgi:hypothetical protein